MLCLIEQYRNAAVHHQCDVVSIDIKPSPVVDTKTTEEGWKDKVRYIQADILALDFQSILSTEAGEAGEDTLKEKLDQESKQTQAVVSAFREQNVDAVFIALSSLSSNAFMHQLQEGGNEKMIRLAIHSKIPEVILVTSEVRKPRSYFT